MALKTCTGVCFTTAYSRKNTNKEQAAKVQQVSPKVGVGNNRPMHGIRQRWTYSTCQENEQIQLT